MPASTSPSRRGSKQHPSRRQFRNLDGRTVQWTFRDGPTKGTTYEHRFAKDGSIGYRAAGAADRSFTPAERGAVVKVSSDVLAVSYLGHAGYTLTTVLDLRAGTMVGFASNGQTWSEQHGTFEFQPDAQDEVSRASSRRRRAGAGRARAKTAPPRSA